MKKEGKILELIKSNKCAVVGVGVSNLPLVDFLLSVGASVTAYDEKSEEALGETAELLKKKGVRAVLGAGAFDRVCEDVIFRSPGVRPDKGALASAEARGAHLVSEMELFFELCPSKKYIVTGSDGKTTTTTLTHLFLDAERKKKGARAFVGGNIGTPLLPRVYEMNEQDAAVLELSSFQLMGKWCEPDAAAITNITPNHLNWHTDMAEYIESKVSAVGDSTKRVVLNADNSICAELDFGGERECIYFSSTKKSFDEIALAVKRATAAIFVKDGMIVSSDGREEKEILSVRDIKLPGRHNIENYMTAIGLTLGEVDLDIYREVAREFGGVEHRLELVAELDGVRYYNSSIDSSPTRTAAALSALPTKPIVICGGAEKGISFEPLAEALFEKAKAVVLNGASRRSMRAALDAHSSARTGELTVIEVETLEEAIDSARALAQNGDTVLLSPAATSFDQFKNFEERGRFFKSRVRSWIEN